MKSYIVCLAMGLLVAGCSHDRSEPAEAPKPAPAPTAEAPATPPSPAAPTAQAPAKPAVPAVQAPPLPAAPAPTPEPVTAKPEAPKPETPTPTPATPAPETPAPALIKAPSHDTEPQDLYFETHKDGKTYIVAYVTTLRLIQKGTLPDDLDEKTGFGPDGETVVFEKSDNPALEKRLVTEYQKQHPKQ